MWILIYTHADEDPFVWRDPERAQRFVEHLTNYGHDVEVVFFP